jgi:hypothetical protein
MAVSWIRSSRQSTSAASRPPSALGTARVKTGRAAAGTLSRRAESLLGAYLEGLGVELHDDAPLFRNRSGRAYSRTPSATILEQSERSSFPVTSGS